MTTEHDEAERETAIAQTMTSIAVMVVAAMLVLVGGGVGLFMGLHGRANPTAAWAMPGTGGVQGMQGMMGSGTMGNGMMPGVPVVPASPSSLSPSATPTPSASPAAPAFSLQGLSAEMVAQYRFVARNPVPYRHVPCFCGCQAMLGHRSLLDCFVRPAGGWESHASGCFVCGEESTQVRTMLARGDPIQKIHDAIVAQFGSLTAPSGA